jgi:hypothetical protein
MVPVRFKVNIPDVGKKRIISEMLPEVFEVFPFTILKISLMMIIFSILFNQFTKGGPAFPFNKIVFFFGITLQI